MRPLASGKPAAPRTATSRTRGCPAGAGFTRRLRFKGFAKTLLMSGGIGCFFLLYFSVLAHPLRISTPMPLTAFDAWVPASSWMLLPYASLWLYLSFAMALAGCERDMRAFAWSAGAMAIVGLAIFWVFPTHVASAGLSIEGEPALAAMRDADDLGNAFPSLHVAFAVFACACIARQFAQMRTAAWLRHANWIWCLLIVVSTLSTKQHVIADVVGGALFGWGFWKAYLLHARQTADAERRRHLRRAG